MKNIILLFLFTLISCSSNYSRPENSQSDEYQSEKGKILFIVSNAHFYGDSDISASNHFSEIVFPYDVLSKAGYVIDFVSPEGGAIPIGYLDNSNETIKKYLFDGSFMDKLEFTLKPEEVRPEDYVAVYYGGGGSAMFGVPENVPIQNIVMQIYEEQNGIVSAVCHGSAGIVHLKKKDGKHLVAGKSVNGFPDKFENMEGRYYQEFPFSIEQKLIEHGGIYKYSETGWDGFYQVDGRLITAQDPTGAATVAEKIIEQLNHSSQ